MAKVGVGCPRLVELVGPVARCEQARLSTSTKFMQATEDRRRPSTVEEFHLRQRTIFRYRDHLAQRFVGLWYGRHELPRVIARSRFGGRRLLPHSSLGSPTNVKKQHHPITSCSLQLFRLFRLRHPEGGLHHSSEGKIEMTSAIANQFCKRTYNNRRTLWKY